MITTSRPAIGSVSPGATARCTPCCAARIGVERRPLALPGVDRLAVVDEVADRQPLGQLQGAAHVVGVKWVTSR